jgi:5-methylcytosine-specific restriction endonuclease McrA
VAALRPMPDVPSMVRKLPVPKTAPHVSSATAVIDFGSPANNSSPIHDAPAPPAVVVAPSPRADVRPLAPERYKVQFTASRETYDKLCQAQDLLRHRVPSGDIAAVVDPALTLLLAALRRTRHAAVVRPQANRRRPLHGRHGRHIPAGVKREAWARDGGRCAFVGAAGRCVERGFLEYYHLVPFTDGGAATVDNLALRCRTHNDYEAVRWFGVREEDLVRDARGVYLVSPN